MINTKDKNFRVGAVITGFMLLMILLCLADAATSGRHTTVVCAGLTMLGLAALAVQSLLSLGEWWRLFNYLALYLPMVCLGVLMAKWQLPDGIVWAWGVAGLVGNQVAILVSDRLGFGNAGVITMLVALYSLNFLNALTLCRRRAA